MIENKNSLPVRNEIQFCNASGLNHALIDTIGISVFRGVPINVLEHLGDRRIMEEARQALR